MKIIDDQELCQVVGGDGTNNSEDTSMEKNRLSTDGSGPNGHGVCSALTDLKEK